MKKLLRNTLISAALCSPSLVLAAAVDFIDNGHYTTDTISGLDWLDVTLTTNKSYFEVSRQFGAGKEFEGWRYATETEFNAMIGNYTDAPITFSFNIWAEPIIDPLIHLLGDTFGALQGWDPDAVDPSKRHFTYGMLADQPTPGKSYLAMIYDRDESDTALDYTNSRKEMFSTVFRAGNIGSYLVRDSELSPVPVPAALPLFATALAAFGWMRRRTKKDRG